MTLREKLVILERAGWKFTRYSQSRKRWVRIRASQISRRFERAVNHAWEQHCGSH